MDADLGGEGVIMDGNFPIYADHFPISRLEVSPTNGGFGCHVPGVALHAGGVPVKYARR